MLKIKTIFISLLLILLWLGFSLQEAYRMENNLVFVYSTEFTSVNISPPNFSPLFKTDQINLRFKADHNYLGIVAFRFHTYLRLNDDYIIFRIKEASSNKWYYESRIRTDQFQPDALFPFGFPPISDSAGKNYIVQIESATGRVGNQVSLSRYLPIATAIYKQPRQEITSSTPHLFTFLVTKLGNLVSKPSYVAFSFIYLLPFILYLCFKLNVINHLSPFYSFVLLCLSVGLDIGLVHHQDSTILVIFVLWCILIRKIKLPSYYSLIFILACFTLSAILPLLPDPNLYFSALRSASWAWIGGILLTLQILFTK